LGTTAVSESKTIKNIREEICLIFGTEGVLQRCVKENWQTTVATAEHSRSMVRRTREQIEILAIHMLQQNLTGYLGDQKT
jgi:hypothetical protein